MKYLDGRPIPFFPLPDVVLYPRILLPLYVFEPRYRVMLTDVLDSYGKIAMARLRPDASPGSDEPEVLPVQGIGHVMTYETRSDGTSNVFLLGESRGRLVEERTTELPYRLGVFEELQESPPPDEERREQLQGQLKRWVRRLVDERVRGEGEEMRTSLRKLQKIFTSQRDTGFLVDFLAHHFLEDAGDKQEILEELDVESRAERLHRLLRGRNLA